MNFPPLLAHPPLVVVKAILLFKAKRETVESGIFFKDGLWTGSFQIVIVIVIVIVIDTPFYSMRGISISKKISLKLVILKGKSSEVKGAHVDH